MLEIPIYHFTHINNLTEIIQNGLIADNFIKQDSYTNIGNKSIKEKRK